jgi:hypothetical protein
MAKFVDDQFVLHLGPGEKKEKMVTYKNSGLNAWPQTAVLKFQTGDRITEPLIAVGKSVAVGETVQIPVILEAPQV